MSSRRLEANGREKDFLLSVQSTINAGEYVRLEFVEKPTSKAMGGRRRG